MVQWTLIIHTQMQTFKHRQYEKMKKTSLKIHIQVNIQISITFTSCHESCHLKPQQKMRQWILSWYAASTFNTCPHQPLPAMTGPPMSIRVKPDAEPVATSRPVRVPAHWREQVAEQLERDVALGVIERAPGTPVTWLHNMVVTAKADGTPRCTVDLQALNKVSVRETHHTVLPTKPARSIPRNRIKTVTDAWNGYHSIPINAEDRVKLTFITEDGRYRYCHAPTGFLSSGDAYTHHYDLIITDVPRVTKCVDDVMLYDDIADREGHWKRVMEYIGKVGHNGVVLNPDKFTVCRGGGRLHCL